jgi:hypothetical protein
MAGTRAFWLGAALVTAAVGAARSVDAQVVTIDFEHFPGPDGQLGTPDDIPIIPNQGWSGVNPGLTSEFATVGVLFTPDPPFLNQNVVVHPSSGPDLTNLLGSFVNPIQGVFPTPVSRVAVEFESANGPLFPDLLEALRADGSVIASTLVNGGPASLQPAEPIYGFRCSWPNGPAPQQVVIDNLSFTTIPAPATPGWLVATAWFGRRRPRAVPCAAKR